MILGRTLLLAVFQRFGVSPSILCVIHQFHYGVRMCVRASDLMV